MKSISRDSNLSLIGLDHNLDLIKSEKHKPTKTFLESVLGNSYIPCITRLTRITHSSATLILKHGYCTRNKALPNVPRVKNKQYKSSIFCKGISRLIDLPHHIHTIQIIKSTVKQ